MVNENSQQAGEGQPSAPSAKQPPDWRAALAILLVGIFLLGFALITPRMLPRPEPLVEKAGLKGKIATAIRNQADLRAIKAIYNDRVPAHWVWVPDAAKHYPGSIPLSVVLDDIRADVFLGDDGDRSIIQRIDELSSEYSQTNPFDKFEPAQRDQFERLREKAGDNYPSFEREVVRIADELYSRNLLTEKYLRDATMSFWVSICAVVFSVVLGAIQLYQGWAHSRIHSRLAENSFAPVE